LTAQILSKTCSLCLPNRPRIKKGNAIGIIASDAPTQRAIAKQEEAFAFSLFMVVLPGRYQLIVAASQASALWRSISGLSAIIALVLFSLNR
jgi:hypothetical protein